MIDDGRQNCVVDDVEVVVLSVAVSSATVADTICAVDELISYSEYAFFLSSFP